MRSQFEDIEPLGMTYPDIGVTKPTDPLATDGKAAILIKMENDKAAVDSMGICAFLSGYKIGLQSVADELEAVTGVRYGVDGWMKAGERIYNLERLFNLGAGLTNSDDDLPLRLQKEPMPAGPAKGSVCKLGEMLPEYYELRGWDKQGLPGKLNLKELNLEHEPLAR